MGSVKDLIVIDPALENRKGLGNFVFSDRYSVFDWGEMPDHISGKGRSLAVMAAFNFEELEKRGIATHYEGLIDNSGKLILCSDLKEKKGGLQTMQVSLARVYHPVVREFLGANKKHEIRYDYSFFRANRGKINNYLIGLEIIFRNGLPLGSSVFKKIEEAKAIANPKERQKQLNKILRSLGLKKEPEPGDMLPKPVMSFTTKLEPGDRGLSEDEAYIISGLRERDFRSLIKLGLRVNDIVTELAETAGFAHYDGKIELIFNNRLVICDVLGTFDENRFSRQGEQISKEVLRQWYKKNQPEFVTACEETKKTGPGWQERCEVKPVKLPKEMSALVSRMYMAGCNRYTQRKIFDVPELEEVLEKLKRYRE